MRLNPVKRLRKDCCASLDLCRRPLEKGHFVEELEAGGILLLDVNPRDQPTGNHCRIRTGTSRCVGVMGGPRKPVLPLRRPFWNLRSAGSHILHRRRGRCLLRRGPSGAGISQRRNSRRWLRRLDAARSTNSRRVVHVQIDTGLRRHGDCLQQAILISLIKSPTSEV